MQKQLIFSCIVFWNAFSFKQDNFPYKESNPEKKLQRYIHKIKFSLFADKPEATRFTSNHFAHAAVEGQQVVLRCTSESHPSSTQKIYFNQNGTSTDSLLFDMSNTEYVINSVNTAQQGIYICAPYNSQGDGPRRSLFLTVNGKIKNKEISKWPQIQRAKKRL